jgi:signal transduction histidine kinase
MRLVSEEFDLRQVLERVGKLFAPKAAEKKLVLDVQIDPSLPERVKGDADRLAQVVSNLVSNAIKFTQTGRVRLSVHTTSRDVSLVGLRIEVEDTGPGMDADTQARLFQAYVQAEGAAQRRSSGGIGLGLAIARQLVQLMGADRRPKPSGRRHAPGGGPHPAGHRDAPDRGGRTDSAGAQALPAAAPPGGGRRPDQPQVPADPARPGGTRGEDA